jgi:hypothetical protein
MNGALSPFSQYVFMIWCLIKRWMNGVVKLILEWHFFMIHPVGPVLGCGGSSGSYKEVAALLQFNSRSNSGQISST